MDQRIIKSLLIRYPLFGSIIVHLNFEFVNTLRKAPAYTDGKTIFYTKRFIDDYTDKEKEFILAHEIFHVVLRHIFRNVDKDPDLLNYVEDGIINQLLVRDGLTMPKNLVDIPDALEYSVDELYMKYLPYLDTIRKQMQEFTYHIEITDLDAWLSELYNKDLQDLMSENNDLRNELLDDFQTMLQYKADSSAISIGMKFPSVKVGKAAPIVLWKELLKANIVSQDEKTPSFFEVEPDGIIKKENKPDESDCESEIIIDSSGSMSMQKIKAIIRECKNILQTSSLKVGFCDDKFHGWNIIKDENDLDSINIVGRGGTNFSVMADSFSTNAINKIVITDGECIFPKGRPDILWVVINRKSFFSDTMKYANYIFIDENDIPTPGMKRLLTKSFI